MNRMPTLLSCGGGRDSFVSVVQRLGRRRLNPPPAQQADKEKEKGR